MKTPVLVLDREKDWKPFAQGPKLINAQKYLSGEAAHRSGDRIINLCQELQYLSSGYYVSLLAEARGCKVIPSVQTILELNDDKSAFQRLVVRRPSGLKTEEQSKQLPVFFGQCQEPLFQALAKAVFSRYPAPILKIDIKLEKNRMVATHVQLGHLANLNEQEETQFADALDHFSHRIWRTSSRKKSRFDLAILINPDEALPPSNKKAIQNFEKMAKYVGFTPEIITSEDEHRLLEFDALFIRCTTAIDDSTYRMARRAVQEGLAIIDHPDAILRCCNKVYMHDLLKANNVSMPASQIVMNASPASLDELVENLGLPMILKVPDGSFSRGVFKVEDHSSLQKRIKKMLEDSAVIMAQAYVPTDFDWRIGILDGRPLYACRYHMAKGHWQVVNHQSSHKDDRKFGDHDGTPIAQVPNLVIRTAIKAAKLFGQGLFGVDLKEVQGEVVVVEVNDNPSIDAGVEDLILGEELYRQIIAHLFQQVQSRGKA